MVLLTRTDYRAAKKPVQNVVSMHVDRSQLPSALRWLFPFALAAGVALELARPFRAGRWRSMRRWP
jgi:hypothetical protein